MRNNLLAVLFFTAMLLPRPVRASHLAGQDFTYVFVGESGGLYHYSVTLTLIQDCLNGQPEAIAEDNPAFFSVYNGGGTLVSVDTTVYYSSSSVIAATANGSCDSFLAGNPICRMKKAFTADFYLPPCATGYTVVYQRCCLNSVANIATPEDVGVTAFCTIPPSGTVASNNSAVFKNYPPLILELGVPLAFDCSATDADGDSLSYSICAPYDGADASTGNIKPIPAFGPYGNYTYLDSFSAGNPMGCSIPLAVDPTTGMLTCTPNVPGVFIVGVCCTEWRSGVAINTVQRVFEFTATDCTASGVAAVARSGGWALFPNPATTSVTILSDLATSDVEISNAIGQVFCRQSFMVGPYSPIDVNISALPAGVYWVRLNGGGARKLVKL